MRNKLCTSPVDPDFRVVSKGLGPTLQYNTKPHHKLISLKNWKTDFSEIKYNTMKNYIMSIIFLLSCDSYYSYCKNNIIKKQIFL